MSDTSVVDPPATERRGFNDPSAAGKLGAARSNAAQAALRDGDDHTLIRRRLMARVRKVVDQGDTDELIRIAPTVRLLTEGVAAKVSNQAGELERRYRAAGFELP